MPDTTSQTPGVIIINRCEKTPGIDIYYCGCDQCKNRGNLWCSRSLWYKHQTQREAQYDNGTLPRLTGIQAIVPQTTGRRQRHNHPDSGPLHQAVASGVDHPGLNQPVTGASSNIVSGENDAQLESDHHNVPGPSNYAGAVSRTQHNDYTHDEPLYNDYDNLPALDHGSPPGRSPSNSGYQDAHDNLSNLPSESTIPVIDTSLKFIHLLHSDPTLEKSNLDADIIYQLQHPEKTPVTLTEEERFSIELFLADINGSEEIYNAVCRAIQRCYPQDKLLSIYEVKCKLREVTGISALLTDMCPKTCVAFTGPYKDLDACPLCNEP